METEEEKMRRSQYSNLGEQSVTSQVRYKNGSKPKKSSKNERNPKYECSLIVTSDRDKKILSMSGFVYVFKR